MKVSLHKENYQSHPKHNPFRNLPHSPGRARYRCRDDDPSQLIPPDCQVAGRASAPALRLDGKDVRHGSLGGKLARAFDVLQTEQVVAAEFHMGLKMLALAVVNARGVDSQSYCSSFVDQPLKPFRFKSWKVERGNVAFVVSPVNGLIIVVVSPTRAHEDHSSVRNTSVLLLPILKVAQMLG